MTCIQYKDYVQVFKLRQKLGHGNCASVMKVENIKTKETYALKYCKFDSISSLVSAIQQIQVIRAIDHQTAIKIFYYFVKSAKMHEIYNQKIQFGMIMQLGVKNLQEDINMRRNKGFAYYTIQQAQTLVIQLIQFFAHMQLKGYMHRDIKPANILLMDQAGQQQIAPDTHKVKYNKKYKVCDFGFAIKQHEFSSKNIAGTSTYASPKIQQKFKNAELYIKGNNYKDDVYSLGVTILQILSLSSAQKLDMGILLLKIHQRYNLKLSQLIKQMLKTQQKSRPDFIALREYCHRQMRQLYSKYPCISSYVREQIKMSEQPKIINKIMPNYEYGRERQESKCNTDRQYLNQKHRYPEMVPQSVNLNRMQVQAGRNIITNEDYYNAVSKIITNNQNRNDNKAEYMGRLQNRTNFKNINKSQHNISSDAIDIDEDNRVHLSKRTGNHTMREQRTDKNKALTFSDNYRHRVQSKNSYCAQLQANTRDKANDVNSKTNNCNMHDRATNYTNSDSAIDEQNQMDNKLEQDDDRVKTKRKSKTYPNIINKCNQNHIAKNPINAKLIHQLSRQFESILSEVVMAQLIQFKLNHRTNHTFNEIEYEQANYLLICCAVKTKLILLFTISQSQEHNKMRPTKRIVEIQFGQSIDEFLFMKYCCFTQKLLILSGDNYIRMISLKTLKQLLMQIMQNNTNFDDVLSISSSQINIINFQYKNNISNKNEREINKEMRKDWLKHIDEDKNICKPQYVDTKWVAFEIDQLSSSIIKAQNNGLIYENGRLLFNSLRKNIRYLKKHNNCLFIANAYGQITKHKVTSQNKTASDNWRQNQQVSIVGRYDCKSTLIALQVIKLGYLNGRVGVIAVTATGYIVTLDEDLNFISQVNISRQKYDGIVRNNCLRLCIIDDRLNNGQVITAVDHYGNIINECGTIIATTNIQGSIWVKLTNKGKNAILLTQNGEIYKKILTQQSCAYNSDANNRVQKQKYNHRTQIQSKQDRRNKNWNRNLKKDVNQNNNLNYAENTHSKNYLHANIVAQGMHQKYQKLKSLGIRQRYMKKNKKMYNSYNE